MTVFLFAPPRQAVEWQPAVDIYKTGLGWVLKLDVAGVSLDDVHVHIGRRSVTVAGVRRDWRLDDASCQHYSMEISYCGFQRTIELPEEIGTAKVRLDYRDGILLVRIDRQEDKDNE